MPRDPNFWRQLAAQDARRAGINPNIFLRQINQESGFNPQAESGAGAIGIAQIVPRYHPNVDPHDPYASLKYAANYMASLIHKYGSYEKALSVYNSGRPETYQDPNFASGQTYNYVKSIMGGQNPSVVNPSASPTAVPALGNPIRNILPVTQDSSKERGLQLLKGLLADKPITSLIQGLRTPTPGLPALPSLNKNNKLPMPSADATLPKMLSSDTSKLVHLGQNADRPGVHTQPAVLQFIGQLAGMYGTPLVIGTGTNHNRLTTTGNVSDHWRGMAADIPASGDNLTRLGRTALIAAGMPRKQAMKQSGGAYQVGRYQILFNTKVGGNHFNHLHVGLRG